MKNILKAVQDELYLKSALFFLSCGVCTYLAPLGPISVHATSLRQAEQLRGLNPLVDYARSRGE